MNPKVVFHKFIRKVTSNIQGGNYEAKALKMFKTSQKRKF